MIPLIQFAVQSFRQGGRVRGGARVPIGLSVHFCRQAPAADPLVFRGARRRPIQILFISVLSIVRGD